MITLDTVTPAQLAAAKLEDYSVVLLANVASLPPPVVEQLERYVDKGGSLLITLGDRVDRDRYNELIGPERMHGGLLPGKLGDRITGPAAGCLAWVAEGHPATAGFESGALGSLTNVTFTERYQIEPQCVRHADANRRQRSGAAGQTVRTRPGDAVCFEHRSRLDQSAAVAAVRPAWFIGSSVIWPSRKAMATAFMPPAAKSSCPPASRASSTRCASPRPPGKAAFFQTEERPAGPELVVFANRCRRHLHGDGR